MYTKNIFFLSLVIFLFLSIPFQGVADSEEIGKIIEKIKVSQDLEKLNDCRTRLRAIDFSQLKTKEKQIQYAEAYEQLAIAFKNHRYSRPAYDIYLKYISLNDTILKLEKSKRFSEVLNEHAELNSNVFEQISESEQERKSLVEEKEALDGIKKSYFRYSAFFSIVLLALFIFMFRKYQNKLNSSRNVLINNRNNIFENRKIVTSAQMAIGLINQVKFLNDSIIFKLADGSLLVDEIEKEYRGLKEVEQDLKSLKENISQLNQLSAISSQTLSGLLQKKY